jgi:predicted amidohydrolase
LQVALIHQVFPDEDGPVRLVEVLRECARRGARLAVLPELPLDRWAPAGREAREEDAEEPGGRRQRALADAARESGVAVLGGAIVRERGRRFNRGLLYDRDGRLRIRYDKLHLPSEDGFWESDHYEPGDEPPDVATVDGLRVGVQLCSDLNRPEGCQLLAARGAEAILAPRATPPASYPRWRDVIRADAITSAAYVLSANRPVPEGGVEIGGPSLAAAPDGTLLLETIDPLSLVTLDREVAARAREQYPGYLARRADLYARAWRGIAREEGSGAED